MSLTRTKLPRSRANLLHSFLSRYSPSSLPTSEGSPATPFASTSSSNPFAPTKAPGANSSTGPKFSIRRQKVLRKHCEALGWPVECLPVAPVKELKGNRLLASVYRSSPHLPRTTVLDELNLEKKGPYIGRKGAAFKGKMWERKMAARQEELRVALGKTEAKEAAWRKTKVEDKIKARPSLPF